MEHFNKWYKPSKTAYLAVILFFIGFIGKVMAQDSDSLVIAAIYKSALRSNSCYKNLEYLSKSIGPRLSGSEGAAQAVKWGQMAMIGAGADTAYLQPVMVPHWVRGAQESAYFESNGQKENVRICALGGSIGTDGKWLSGKVIEVKSFEELEKIGRKIIQGKIVFYNRPMDPSHLHTFDSYGEAVNQRWAGAMNAARYGAIASITRSMTTEIDEFPHTGSMGYADSLTKIPAIAISTLHAEQLSYALTCDLDLTFSFKTNCQNLPDVLSYNVIGEIRGQVNPKEVILVGGHLDCWDNGNGAHDDGAGCVQSIEVLRLLKENGIKPNHTIRAVLFMNEENGLRGGKKYAEEAEKKKEAHIAAIESDAGGFTPRGFSFDAPEWFLLPVKKMKKKLIHYGLHDFEDTGGGADIGPLKKQGVPLIGLRPDSQRYFNYHHTEIDTFDKVNKRELALGAAAMGSLIYLIDQTHFH